MKRLLLLLALLAPLQAMAQIQIKKESSPITILASKQNLVSELYEVVAIPVDTASIYSLYVQTNNRYDDRMKIWLGLSQQEAVASLRQIEALLDEKMGTSFELPLVDGVVSVKVRENGTALFPTKKNKIGLYLSGKGYAGGQVITRPIIESLIKQTEEYGKNAND